MSITRRFFIGGLSAFGAAGPGILLAAPGAVRGRPRLRFGVVTDVHLAFYGKGFVQDFDPPVIRHAFEWFRDQNVDAVLCGGDIADRSLIDEMRTFADTWFSVFPGDRRPDGQKVERVFVTGNHDAHGHKIYKGLPRIWPDPDELQRHIFNDRRAEVWKELFHEDYSEIFMKKVKGYAFIGSMWDDGDVGVDAYRHFGRIVPFMEKHGASLDPKKPFFYIQHPHPKDTCYGPWAWGHDNGEVTACLSKFPNAVAFSGHSHYPLTDERSIWQGAFTSVGAASLRYGSNPHYEFQPEGFENGGGSGSKGKLSPSPVAHESRHGLLVSVYDDCIVYSRRDFRNDLPIGDDWVQPLAAAEPKPFAFTTRAEKSSAPQFPNGAKLSLSRVKAKTRGGEEKDAVEVTIPPADAKGGGRTLYFDVVAGKKGGDKRRKRVLATGWNVAAGAPLAAKPTPCRFALDELPAPDAAFAVVPVNCFGKRGRALVAHQGQLNGKEA